MRENYCWLFNYDIISDRKATGLIFIQSNASFFSDAMSTDTTTGARSNCKSYLVNFFVKNITDSKLLTNSEMFGYLHIFAFAKEANDLRFSN